MRIGFGYDVHALVKDRKLILGGIEIPHTHGLLGHSDADVLLHSISDSLLGAAALGDIGRHFPDSDPKYKNANSLLLLKEVGRLLKGKGFNIGNIDATVIAQAPKISPYIEQMREKISEALDLDLSSISIKATTTEHLGFEGRKEGISAASVSLIYE